MTTIHGASALGPASASTFRISGFLGRCCRALQERRKREMSRAALRELSDRQFKDIGLAPKIEPDPERVTRWVRLEWL